MIIQSICLLDQLDKDLNTFAMRVREWYCWHFPELRELVKDNYLFARCAAFIQDRTSLTEDKLPELTEIVMDEDLAKQIIHVGSFQYCLPCSSAGIEFFQFPCNEIRENLIFHLAVCLLNCQSLTRA